MSWLKKRDIDIYNAIKMEVKRENEKIILIPSENYVSRAILEAQGSLLTNKYAEGYIGKRYYGGCEYADVVESLAINRAKELFRSSDHVNVQPHSGSQANMAVYFSVLKPGDTIMGMDLSQGGHLTHGSHVSFSGIIYKPVYYGVDRETGVIDYNEVARIAEDARPKIIVAGASSYSRILDFKKFREIADSVGAYLMADIAHIAGMVAASIHPSPILWADFVTGTTHKTLRGPRGGFILCRERFARVVDKSIFPGIQGGPLMHIIAAKATAFKEAMTDEFRDYQRQVVTNAKILASKLIEYGFKVVSGGTDTHLMLIDLTDNDITGKDAETLLDKAGVTVNKNAIPHDKRPPAVTSGIRIGTPIVTTRGMKEPEMAEIAEIIKDVLNNANDKKVLKKVDERVRELCERFPFMI
ncbi:MAG: serine hydroxymethyltransferase [Nitrospirota bacterium]